MPDTTNFHLKIAVADDILRGAGSVNVFDTNLAMVPNKLNSLKRVHVFHNKLIDIWITHSDNALKKCPVHSFPGSLSQHVYCI